jgi:hypothetical protein
MWPRRVERYRLEIFRWNIWKNEVRIGLEAKATVVFGLPKQYTASRATLTEDTQSFVHKAGAHALRNALTMNCSV